LYSPLQISSADPVDLAFLLVFAGSPYFSSRGHGGKAVDYTVERETDTSKAKGFRQDRHTAADNECDELRRLMHLPGTGEKKNPSRLRPGFESTKGGGWRRHWEIDGVSCGRCGGLGRWLRFRTLARCLRRRSM